MAARISATLVTVAHGEKKKKKKTHCQTGKGHAGEEDL